MFSTARLRTEFCCVVFILISVWCRSQPKQVNYQNQSWVSVNSTLKFDPNWGVVADFHMRRDDLFKHDFFYLMRFGAIYWIKKKHPVVVGYAHSWQAPPPGSQTWQNENRIYQQGSVGRRFGITASQLRLRIEERWRDVITNDTYTGEQSFSLRFRLLSNFEFAIFKNSPWPSLIASDEVLLQTGKGLENNTFDQNRLFLGIKVYLKPDLNFDFGYMNIYQKRPDGFNYTMSHVLRLFFYYTPDLRTDLEIKPTSIY